MKEQADRMPAFRQPVANEDPSVLPQLVQDIRRGLREVGMLSEPVLKRGHYVFRGRHEGAEGNWTTYVHVRPEPGYFTISSWLPAIVPVKRRRAVMELLNDYNWRSGIGAYSIELNSGTVTSEQVVPVGDGRISDGLVEMCMSEHLRSLKSFLPVIMSVAHGNVTPRRAMESFSRRRRGMGSVDGENDTAADKEDG
jgi:hypothetical protein